jgi:hypothetical protein
MTCLAHRAWCSMNGAFIHLRSTKAPFIDLERAGVRALGLGVVRP